MNCLKKGLREWRGLNNQSLPGYGFHLLDRCYWLIAYSIMGYCGKGNLGAIILALAIYNLCNVVMEAIISTQIIFLKASKNERFDRRLFLVVSMIVVICVCITVGVFLIFNYILYFYLGLNPNTKTKAIEFSWLLFPSFLFDGFQKLFQQLLMIRGYYKGVLISLAAGIVVNILGNTVFVVLLVWGPQGSALSISISKFAVFMLMGWFFRNATHTDETPPQYALNAFRAVFTRQSSSISPAIRNDAIELVRQEESDNSDEDSPEDDNLLPDNRNLSTYSNEKIVRTIIKYLILSFTRILMLIADSYPYEILPLIIANLGNVSLSTSQMLIFLAQSFSISLIFPLSVVVSNRVFRALSDNQVTELKYTVAISIMQTLLAAVGGAVIYYFFWNNLGYLFTSNDDIIGRTSSLMLFATSFLFAHCLQTLLQGILRGAGYQLEIFGLNFLSLWCLGVPLGIYLCYFSSPTNGLEGIWFALLLGVSLQTLVMLLVLLCIDWNKESRKIRHYNQITKDSVRFYPFEDVTQGVLGSRAIGGFFISLKTVEDELLELEAIEMEEPIFNP